MMLLKLFFEKIVNQAYKKLINVHPANIIGIHKAKTTTNIQEYSPSQGNKKLIIQ